MTCLATAAAARTAAARTPATDRGRLRWAWRRSTLCEVCDCRTTTRQNAHGTEVVVLYRWHPWCGKTVQVMSLVEKRPETVLRVKVECAERSPLRELPVWMTDSAECASMVLANEPIVSSDSLRSLRNLLEAVRSEVVERQHLEPESEGDADEKTPSSDCCSDGSVSSAADPAPVEGSTVGSKAAGARTRSAAAEGAAERKGEGQ